MHGPYKIEKRKKKKKKEHINQNIQGIDDVRWKW